MKQYSAVSDDVIGHVEAIRAKHHIHLFGVTIGLLFVFSDESEQVLEHEGYRAAAVAKIVGLRERAAGMADALIVFDRYVWSGLSSKAKDALVDHELTHIVPVIKEDTGAPKHDSLGRFKLRMRKHDHQIGWFDDVVNRHAEHSVEMQQVAEILAGNGQMFFDFARAEAA